MADSPQRIDALYLQPPAVKAIGVSLLRLPSSQSEKSLELGSHSHRSVELTDRVSRALTVGGRGKQDMDVLRASQGRMP